jgi:hypothetical protein
MRMRVRDRRAMMIEGGMQNSGLALGIIAVQFNSDLGMVTIASLWGIWHIVSGLACALLAWRDARSGGVQRLRRADQAASTARQSPRPTAATAPAATPTRQTAWLPCGPSTTPVSTPCVWRGRLW